MRSVRHFLFVSRRTRQYLTGVALVAYLLSVGGFPLPQAVTKDSAARFPCENHRCGCATADQCWHSCCCFTPAERIAWAQSNNVAIPADVQLAMTTEHEHADEHEGCCTQHAAHDDDSHSRQDCDHTAAADEARQSCGHCAEPNHGLRVTWVLSVAARKCQGLSNLWITSGAALPLDIPTLWEFDWAPAGELVPTHDRPLMLAYAPPVPPPRA